MKISCLVIKRKRVLASLVRIVVKDYPCDCLDVCVTRCDTVRLTCATTYSQIFDDWQLNYLWSFATYPGKLSAF